MLSQSYLGSQMMHLFSPIWIPSSVINLSPQAFGLMSTTYDSQGVIRWLPFDLSDHCPVWCECLVPHSLEFCSSSVVTTISGASVIVFQMWREAIIREKGSGRQEQDVGSAFKGFVVEKAWLKSQDELQSQVTYTLSDKGCAELVASEVSMQFLVKRLKNIFTEVLTHH